VSDLAALYEEVRSCRACVLCESRLNAVPGEGCESAGVMFIGEAPGYHENQQGRPFVGAAGQFLDELLESIGLKRKDVYIANVIKCRPPSNRDPMPEEIAACQPFIDRQVDLIQPKLLVTLGRFSMAKYFPGEKISRIHGVARRRGDVLYYPMYHPAAALHQASLRGTVEADMKKIPVLLAEAMKVNDVRSADPLKQLSLF
jgi:uracil-DNA glycosylase